MTLQSVAISHVRTHIPVHLLNAENSILLMVGQCTFLLGTMKGSVNTRYSLSDFREVYAYPFLVIWRSLRRITKRKSTVSWSSHVWLKALCVGLIAIAGVAVNCDIKIPKILVQHCFLNCRVSTTWSSWVIKEHVSFSLLHNPPIANSIANVNCGKSRFGAYMILSIEAFKEIKF